MNISPFWRYIKIYLPILEIYLVFWRYIYLQNGDISSFFGDIYLFRVERYIFFWRYIAIFGDIYHFLAKDISFHTNNVIFWQKIYLWSEKDTWLKSRDISFWEERYIFSPKSYISIPFHWIRFCRSILSPGAHGSHVLQQKGICLIREIHINFKFGCFASFMMLKLATRVWGESTELKDFISVSNMLKIFGKDLVLKVNLKEGALSKKLSESHVAL